MQSSIEVEELAEAFENSISLEGTIVFDSSNNDAVVRLNNLLGYGWEYYNLKKNQFNCVGSKFKLYGKEVDKLQLVRFTPDNILVYSLLVVRYADQITHVYRVKLNRIERLKEYFDQLGTTVEKVFSRRNGKAHEWQTKSQIQIYAKQVKLSNDVICANSIYNLLHKKIIESIIQLLINEPDCDFNIVDSGCGNGVLLKSLETEIALASLAKKLPLCQLFGFDFNGENIRDSTAGYRGQCYFFTADICDYSNVVKQIESILPQADHNVRPVKTILIMSGVLTRLVLNDVHHGLTALTAITQSQSVDYLIGGGAGEPMINGHLAKQFGYSSLQSQPISSFIHNGNFFYYRKMQPAELVNYKLDKLRKKNILDLTFYSHPLTILNQLIAEVNNDTIIDLSYSQYTDEIEQFLDAIIDLHPRVKLIFQHCHNEQATKFVSHFQGKVRIHCERHNNLQDAELFGPIRRYPRFLMQHSSPSDTTIFAKVPLQLV